MNWRRGFLRLWMFFSLLWVVATLVAFGGDMRTTWRRATADNTAEAVVDRTLAWLPMFRREPLTGEEKDEAYQAMQDGLSLIARSPSSWEDSPLASPEGDALAELPPGFVLEEPLSSPDYPALDLIDGFEVGKPPKVLHVTYLDSWRLNVIIEKVSNLETDPAVKKKNLAAVRRALLEGCGNTPRRCSRIQPTVAEALFSSVGITLGPPIGLLCCGAMVAWIVRGFRPQSPV